MSDDLNDAAKNSSVPRTESKATSELKASHDIRDGVIDELMRSLVCDKFEIDQYSSFCNECGYSFSEHRKILRTNTSAADGTKTTQG